MKKLEKINIRNISLNRNNNIRKYYMETDYKNKSLVIENNISKLLKGEINRKDSNYKLIKKNNNNKVKNKRCKKKDENNIKTNYKCIKRYSDYIISTKLSNISQRSTLFKTEDSIKKIKENKNKQKKNIRKFEIEKENTNNRSMGKKILQPKEENLNKIINKTKIEVKNKYNSIKNIKKIANNDNMIAENEKTTMLTFEDISSFEEFKKNEKKNKIKIYNISNKNRYKYFKRLINSNDNKKIKRQKISIQDYNVFEKNEQEKFGCNNISAREYCNVF